MKRKAVEEKKFKIRNYRGDIVESIGKFRKSFPNLHVACVREDGGVLRIFSKPREFPILEDKEGKNINKAEKWIKDHHPEVIGKKLDDGRTVTPRVLTQEIRNTVPNVRMCDCKFLVGTTRLYFDLQGNVEEFQSRMNRLNKILKIICSAHEGEYDNDFNGKSFEELDGKFKSAVQKELSSDKEEIGKLSLLGKSDYEIVPIDSFEEAKKYGKYVSWCVTHQENMYSTYTNGGIGRFYFCLKPGYEKVSKERGEGCPMDTYGKSMIAVSVNDDGSLNTCTCRWNHENGGNDSMMDTREISEFFGLNFYKTFKPYSPEDLMRKFEEIRYPDDDFCKLFGCIKVKTSGYKKIINGEVENLIKISDDIAFINGKFVSIRDGKFVEGRPKSIGNYAFDDCKNLKSIEIPDSVKSIGNYAFNDCKNLKSIEIPDSVESIGDYAFSHCESLKSIEISDSVKSIGDSAFYGCYNLKSIKIPDSVESIEGGAFSYCKSLKSIEISDSVKSIGYGAFDSCYNLKSIKIPDSVENIGEYAFDSCYNLKSIEIPDSVKSIGYGAFVNCKNLKSIEISNSVKSIGDSAFSHCESLKSVKIPNSVESIGGKTFFYCKGLESIEIPDSVENIGDGAFSYCKSLKSIKIPDSVKRIGYGAFVNCKNLKSIEIPNSVENIGDGAFDSCYNLKSIKIPDSVESIGYAAFSYCVSLETIYCSEKTFNKFNGKFPKDAVRKDISQTPKNESADMKKFKVRNYRGDIVESLSKFQKAHSGLKVVEAVEAGDELKIKAKEVEEAKKISAADEELQGFIEEFFYEKATSGEIYDTDSEMKSEIRELADGDADPENRTVELCKEYLRDECGIDVFKNEDAYDDFICDELQRLAGEYLSER